MKTRFDIPPVEWDIDLPVSFCQAFRQREFKTISEWAEEEFILPIGYAAPGPVSFKGREWQIELLNDPLYYDECAVVASTQIGKSVGWHIQWAWAQEFVQENSLVAFADEDTVKGVFEERLKPSVQESLAHLWDGNQDRLRQDKLILHSGITRCTSCRVEAGFSTFAASWIFCDEVAKWKTPFDALAMARGRMQDYRGMMGYHAKMVKVSSPKKVGDVFYNDVHTPGTLHLYYKMPCPHCNHYQVLEDNGIVEIPNENGEKDHDPTRIKRSNAAYYQCKKCRGRIEDTDRMEMLRRGVWATLEEKVSESGIISNPDKLRKTARKVCRFANRLLSMPQKYSFADALAAFFEARKSSDPKQWEIYQNEHAARFIDTKSEAISHKYLESKKRDYKQRGEKSFLPTGVLVLTVGVDTQDAGFYYTVVGWGLNMESWRVQHDFIEASMHDKEFKNPANVLEVVRDTIIRQEFTRVDGVKIPLSMIVFDEGGHRVSDVRYITSRIPQAYSYKGGKFTGGGIVQASTKVNKLILGDTETLSKQVQEHIRSETWNLPSDIGEDYLLQVNKQFFIRKVDSNGRTKNVWVHGGEDHYRDTENMNMAAAHALDLHNKLNDPSKAQRLQNDLKKESIRLNKSENTEAGNPAPPTTRENRSRRRIPTQHRTMAERRARRLFR